MSTWFDPQRLIKALEAERQAVKDDHDIAVGTRIGLVRARQLVKEQIKADEAKAREASQAIATDGAWTAHTEDT